MKDRASDPSLLCAESLARGQRDARHRPKSMVVQLLKCSGAIYNHEGGMNGKESCAGTAGGAQHSPPSRPQRIRPISAVRARQGAHRRNRTVPIVRSARITPLRRWRIPRRHHAAKRTSDGCAGIRRRYKGVGAASVVSSVGLHVIILMYLTKQVISENYLLQRK